MTRQDTVGGLRDYFEERNSFAHQVRRLESALRDIASSEPIPTPRKGWEFCRDVARVALKTAGGEE